MSDIEKIINDAWKIKDQINKNSDKSIIDSIDQIIDNLDKGKLRVAEKIDGGKRLSLAYVFPCRKKFFPS